MIQLLQRIDQRLPGGRLRQALRDTDRRSHTDPGVHWAVAQFPPQATPWLPGSRVCPVGSRTRAEHLGREPLGDCEMPGPDYPFNEEYFEWAEIFSAALGAGETFTFAEIGAGYGRWTSRAAGAARRAGKRFRAALAEGAPRHARFLREHMADNEIDDLVIFDAAVGGERRITPMSVWWPPESDTPEGWYGQSIGWREGGLGKAVGSYFGRPVYEMDGNHFIEVQEIPLSDVLQAYDHFDLVDLDIQGAEARAIRSGIDLLNQRCARLYIETHNRTVEADLRNSLGGAGWLCLRDYPCSQENDTPFGRTFMDGGIQIWANPRRFGRR